MLTNQEKAKVKDVLADGLGISRNINLPYFLNSIDATKKEVAALKTQLDSLLNNQIILDRKLDRIIRLLDGR